ncbi:hypothetical protein J6590_080151 [Homalodisca vitripennis]|nr:hypothetical protein J6590_080151 [Homalodisca vitripennis]
MVKPLRQVPWLLQCEHLFHKARSMNLEHGLHNHKVSGITIGGNSAISIDLARTVMFSLLDFVAVQQQDPVTSSPPYP